MGRTIQSRSKQIVVTGAVGVIAAISIGIGLFLLRGSPQVQEHKLPTFQDIASAGVPYTSYYFEAEVTWGSTQQSANPQIMRGWFQSGSGTRWDISTSQSMGRPNFRTVILTDKEFIYYEPETNSFQRQPIPASGSLTVPMPFLSNLALGPLVSYLNESGAVYEGTATVLGRKTEVWLTDNVGETSTSIPHPGSPSVITRSKTPGSMRFWVDGKHQFVLKQMREASDFLGSFVAEATKVEFNKQIPPSTFTLDAPASARRVPRSLTFAPPLLSPNYIPDVPYRGSSSGSGGDPNGHYEEKGLELTNGRLTIRQQRLTSAQALPDGEPVSVNGAHGVLTTADNIISVTWDVDGLRIRVSGPLPAGEILKVAASIR